MYAIMNRTIGNAGTLEKIRAGERVRVYPCSNLPDNGADERGAIRFFVVSASGVESLAYASEFDLERSFSHAES